MADISSFSNSSNLAPDAFRENLRKLDRRQWWLWSSAVLFLVLLTIAVASLAFPAMLDTQTVEHDFYSFYLNQAVRALVGIVLVFAVYVVYQQTMIIRMRNTLADQIQNLARSRRSQTKSTNSPLLTN